MTERDETIKSQIERIIQNAQDEDLIGEATILPVLRDVVGMEVALGQGEFSWDSLVAQIKNAAQRNGAELPTGWKSEIAGRIVVDWSTMDPKDIPADMIDRAESLFEQLVERFEGLDGDRILERGESS